MRFDLLMMESPEGESRHLELTMWDGKEFAHFDISANADGLFISRETKDGKDELMMHVEPIWKQDRAEKAELRLVAFQRSYQFGDETLEQASERILKLHCQCRVPGVGAALSCLPGLTAGCSCQCHSPRTA